MSIPKWLNDLININVSKLRLENTDPPFPVDPEELKSFSWKSPLRKVPTELAVKDHPVWDEIKPREIRGGFVSFEFNNPYRMDVAFLRWLWYVRQLAGVPMKLNSDFRDDDVGASLSAHMSEPCRAVDIQVYNSLQRGRISFAAIVLGCRRVGTYQGEDRRQEEGWPSHASDASGLHLDCSAEGKHPSPRNWTKY